MDAHDLMEDCVSCRTPTDEWWGDGCLPLCNYCYEAWADIIPMLFSMEQGYGPLPKSIAWLVGELEYLRENIRSVDEILSDLNPR